MKPPRRATKCKTCLHADRGRIELMHVGGVGLDTLARKFGLSRDSIHRHCRDHLSDTMRAAYVCGPVKLAELAERAAEENVSLLDYFALLRNVLLDQFGNAASAGDRNATAVLSGRLLEVLREIGKLTGEVSKAAGSSVSITNQILVLQSPVIAQLQAAIIDALRAYPDARAAVIAAFRRLEHEKHAESARMIEAPAVRADHAAA